METFKQGLVYMFRTLFTRGYYQYIESILWPGPEQFQAVCVCVCIEAREILLQEVILLLILW